MQNKNILLVEDDINTMILVTTLLEDEEYNVLKAEDGLQALEMVKNKPPDLILLDLMIPEIDGFEVCKRIKNDKTTKHIPIIMLTAKSNKKDKIHGLSVGADDYITKPFDLNELLARIKNLLTMQSLQQEIIETQVGAKFSQLRLNFISMISHELRTPLNTILGYADILEDNQENNLTEKQISYIKDLHTNANNLLEKIENLIAFSKTFSTNQKVKKSFFLSDIIASTFSFLNKQVEQKMIEIKTNIPVDIEIYGIEEMYQQIFLSLLDNAIKFSEENGHIEVIAQKLENEIEVVIKDNGIGFKDSEVESLFESFVQGDSSYTRKYSGMGLGLSLVKKHLETINGTIKAEHNKPKGAKLTLTFPLDSK